MGSRREKSKTHGRRNPAARAPNDLTLAEGATAWSDCQTRSKGQAVPVCLGPLDKPIFDQIFAVPFIEGLKELYDSVITPALRHIVRSAQKYGTESKIHKTPKAMVIRLGTFYSSDNQSIGGREQVL